VTRPLSLPKLLGESGVDEYFTDDYVLHRPAGEFNRDQIMAYHAAHRASFSAFTILATGIAEARSWRSTRECQIA
jgi:hypothetical protein